MVCAYDPVGYGVPYNHLMFSDSREAVVEGALQVLCVTLENESSGQNVSVDGTSGGTAMEQDTDVSTHNKTKIHIYSFILFNVILKMVCIFDRILCVSYPVHVYLSSLLIIKYMF